MALPLACSQASRCAASTRALAARAAYVAIATAAALVLVALALARRAFVLAIAVAVLAGGFAAAGWQASLRAADALPAARGSRSRRHRRRREPAAARPERFRFAVDPGGAPEGVPGLRALGW